MAERRADDGLWVYGVVDAAVDGPPPCRGVDGARQVELIRYAELAAVASRVSLEAFGERGLRELLEDLDRLDVLARAHERVLDAALRRGAVVPFPICTIYTSVDRVRAMLGREREPLAAALWRLRGMAEWGVQAFAPPAAEGASVAAPAPASGTDYLARKRTARDAAEMARRGLDAAVEALHARLRARAARAVLSPPQERRLSGREGPMLLNAAYLVADTDAEGFGALVAELARRLRADGLELVLTGPWPPYHFVR